MNAPTQPRLIVGLGELLFDIIDDQPILGGAPVNFAVQAHQVLASHGFRGVPAVRLGNDSLAKEAVNQLSNFGLNTDYIQFDDKLPTGRALVHREDEGHRFEIVEGVCWDHYTWTDTLANLSKSAAVVCFGTLGQRSPVSQATIQRFIENASQALRIFDVNLRQHYYSSDILRHGCRYADVLKLNEEELEMVLSALDIAPTQSAIESCQQILHHTPIQYVVYTQGPLGTTIITHSGIFYGKPPTLTISQDSEPADSVGAGDACTAGIVAGLLLSKPLQETVELANRLGAYVASKPGATPTLPATLMQQ